MSRRSEIREEVFRILRTLAPQVAITEHQHLIADLKLLSDDATAMALQLERKYGVYILRTEWRKVLTVGDVIELFIRHVQ